MDAHNRVNMAVALDANGGEVARWRGPNSVDGWRQLAALAAELGDARWGVEGAWNDGRGLAQSLVEAGAAVYEVNARWTASADRVAASPERRLMAAAWLHGQVVPSLVRACARATRLPSASRLAPMARLVDLANAASDAAISL